MQIIFMVSRNYAVAPLMFGDRRIRAMRTIAAKFSSTGEQYAEVRYSDGSSGIIGFNGSSWMEQPYEPIQPNHPAYTTPAR